MLSVLDEVKASCEETFNQSVSSRKETKRLLRAPWAKRCFDDGDGLRGHGGR